MRGRGREGQGREETEHTVGGHECAQRGITSTRECRSLLAAVGPFSVIRGRAPYRTHLCMRSLFISRRHDEDDYLT